MTPNQTLAVTVRLFALWLFFYAIPNLLGIFKSINSKGEYSYMLPDFLIASSIMLAICMFLWFFPLFIAKRILPLSQTWDSKDPEFKSWFSVGCSLIGLWLLSSAIPSLFSYITAYIVVKESLSEAFNANPRMFLNLIFNIFQLITGIWLFIGGKGLKKILYWAKYA